MRDTQEEWREIEETEGKYSVSNLGKIRNNGTGHILIPSSKNGYLKVNLHYDGKRITRFVHRLVAIAFIPNPEDKPQVNHINGIHGDARVENLEWVTPEENLIHSAKNHLYEKGMAKIGTSEYVSKKERDRKRLLKKTEKITESQLNEIVEAAEKNDVTVYKYFKGLESKIKDLQQEISKMKNNNFLADCLQKENKSLSKVNEQLRNELDKKAASIGYDNPAFAIGNKQNYLTIIGYCKDEGNHTRLVCRCDCGNIRIEHGTAWRLGKVKSCGCMHDELMRQTMLRKRGVG